MLRAIITSLNQENLLATPSAEVDLAMLVGRDIRYVDGSNKIWPGKITGFEDPFVVIKFDNFPTGLGQGQIVEIMEEGDDINQL